MFRDISSQELNQLILSGQAEIIDVRESDEFDLIRIKYSKLIPMGEIFDRLSEIEWDKKVVVVCRTGSRSRHVALKLGEFGESVLNLEKGIKELYENSSDHLVYADQKKVEEYLI